MATKKTPLFHLFFIYSHIQASCFHHFVKTPTLPEQGNSDPISESQSPGEDC